MNNQNDLFYNTPPILFNDLDNYPDDNLNDNLLSSSLLPILYQGNLADEVPILEFDLDNDIDFPNLDDDIDLSDLEFDENLVDDLGVFTPPSSPKSVFNAPKTISDIFDFFSIDKN